MLGAPIERSTPAKSDLFSQGNDDDELDNVEADIFHSTVQKLMYICKGSRPDIEPELSYLCPKVTRPSTNNKEKLDCSLDFIQGTISDRRILGAMSLEEMITWIDASFAIHANERSHTGGTISFGICVIHAKSLKQKLNTKSSTEAEFVGVNEYLPYHIWIINFLKCQGYDIKNKILYQDNESAIKMGETHVPETLVTSISDIFLYMIESNQEK